MNGASADAEALCLSLSLPRCCFADAAMGCIDTVSSRTTPAPRQRAGTMAIQGNRRMPAEFPSERQDQGPCTMRAMVPCGFELCAC